MNQKPAKWKRRSKADSLYGRVSSPYIHVSEASETASLEHCPDLSIDSIDCAIFFLWPLPQNGSLWFGESVCVCVWGGLNSDMCGMMWLHLIKNYLGIAIFNHLDVCIPIIVCELYYHLIQYSFMIYSVILNITSVSKNTFLWQILMTNLWKSPLEKNQNMSRLKLYWMFVHITQDN